MKTDHEDRRKIARWCESAGVSPLDALTRLWRVLDENRELIDDVGPKAKERIGRMEEFALDCRRAYWAHLGFGKPAEPVAQPQPLGGRVNLFALGEPRVMADEIE